jgi:hypothetical protein
VKIKGFSEISRINMTGYVFFKIEFDVQKLFPPFTPNPQWQTVFCKVVKGASQVALLRLQKICFPFPGFSLLSGLK